MRKKGDVATPVLIFGIIALVVFGIAAASLFKVGLPDWFKNLLPGFDNNQSPVTSLQVVRYQIDSDNVQYYDGSQWRDFREPKNWQVVVGDKQVYWGDAHTDFVEYYYGWEGSPFYSAYKDVYAKRGIRRTLIPWHESVPLQVTYFYNASDPNGKMGIAYISFMQKLSDKNTLFYNFAFDGKLYDGDNVNHDVSLVTNPTVIRQYGDPVGNWRDAVFAVPVRISYKEIKGKEITPKQDYFCTRRIGSDIIVDLSKPVSASTVCT
ncbi:hypothetical protein KW805_02690 [Candidatus Pacearchaeota archaeon]|nr:hypothetical protein [Candidatus Pacearchaeota archaeon]